MLSNKQKETIKSLIKLGDDVRLAIKTVKAEKPYGWNFEEYRRAYA